MSRAMSFDSCALQGTLQPERRMSQRKSSAMLPVLWGLRHECVLVVQDAPGLQPRGCLFVGQVAVGSGSPRAARR